jgi:hypothetical protein
MHDEEDIAWSCFVEEAADVKALPVMSVKDGIELLGIVAKATDVAKISHDVVMREISRCGCELLVCCEVPTCTFDAYRQVHLREDP